MVWETNNSNDNSISQSSVKCMPFKLSRVRFLSEPEINCAELLVTGTWMEKVNRICLWQYGTKSFFNNGSVQSKYDCKNDHFLRISDSADDPHFISSVVHPGSVQDMKVHYLTQRVFTASSDGSLQIFQLDNSNNQVLLYNLMSGENSWFPFGNQMDTLCGHLPIALASLSVNTTGDRIYAANDLGQLAVIQLDHLCTNDSDKSDSVVVSGSDICTVNAIENVDDHLLITVNQLGQLKVWDLRIGLVNPQRRLLRPGETLPLLCIAHHPGRSHLLSVAGVGASNGAAAYIWDLRAEQYPLTEVACDGQVIWETAFHPRQPAHIYMATESAGLLQISDRDGTNSWTECRGSRKKLTVSSVLPQGVNCSNVISFDVTHTHLACARSDAVLHTLSCDKCLY